MNATDPSSPHYLPPEGLAVAITAMENVERTGLPLFPQQFYDHIRFSADCFINFDEKGLVFKELYAKYAIERHDAEEMPAASSSSSAHRRPSQTLMKTMKGE